MSYVLPCPPGWWMAGWLKKMMILPCTVEKGLVFFVYAMKRSSVHSMYERKDDKQIKETKGYLAMHTALCPFFFLFFFCHGKMVSAWSINGRVTNKRRSQTKMKNDGCGLRRSFFTQPASSSVFLSHWVWLLSLSFVLCLLFPFSNHVHPTLKALPYLQKQLQQAKVVLCENKSDFKIRICSICILQAYISTAIFHAKF